MTSKDLKILMLQADIRQVDVAAAVGISRDSVCHVVSGRDRSRRIESCITEKLKERLKIPEAGIFPLEKAGQQKEHKTPQVG